LNLRLELRYFRTTVPAARFTCLCPKFVQLLVQLYIFSAEIVDVRHQLDGAGTISGQLPQLCVRGTHRHYSARVILHIFPQLGRCLLVVVTVVAA